MPIAASGGIEGRVKCSASCDNYVIYLKSVPGDYSAEGNEVVLDQVNKTFIPHVMPVLKGATLRLKNGDPFLHNVHAYVNKQTFFNRALPPIKGVTIAQVLKDPATYVMLCDVHTEMSAYLVVLENPFFTQPDESGFYLIRSIPPGEYTLVRYDPEEKELVEKKVSISGTTVRVDF